MGWCSGGDLADNLWSDIKGLIPKKNRKQAAEAFIKHFERYDCDVMCETALWEAAGRENEFEEE